MDTRTVLEETFRDRHLSRAEKKVLRDLLETRQDNASFHKEIMTQAFEIAREYLQPSDRSVINWLEGVAKLVSGQTKPKDPIASACFSPGPDCRAKLVELLSSCTQSAAICVFTISDDRLAERIIAAHQRGVRVRIITDDDKSSDRGSDITRLAEAGIPIKTDGTPHHMHHKFALFDGILLVTGSYNWTRSAAEVNLENLIVTGRTSLIKGYENEFEKLWRSLPDFNPS